MPGRRRQNLSLCLVGAATIFGSFNPAKASPHRPLRTATEQRAPFFDAFPWGSVPDSPRLVRRLAENSHPLSTQRLLEAADASNSSTNFLLRLSLVEALHGRTHGSRRDEVVRCLLRFFRGVDASVSPGTRKVQEESGLAEEDRVRASAALALAYSGHREALTALFAFAAADHPADRAGKILATLALSEVPEARAALLRMGFKQTQIDHSLAPPKASGDFEVASPLALAQLADEPHQWARELSQLASPKGVPGAFLEADAWSKSLAQAPVWSLRALTCLSAKSIPQLQKHALGFARKHQNSADPQLRLTALWTISVIDPKRVSSRFASAEDETLSVLLRQSFHGARATEAALFEPSHPERSAVLRATAMGVSLLDPETWRHHSDRELWALGDEPLATKEWIAPLALRALPTRGPVRPGVIEQLDNWLRSDSPAVRSAAVRGLALSGSTSALGLLVKAYRRELDPRVRRAICQSLAPRRTSLPKLIAQISELDPDKSCRSLILSRPDPEGTGFFVGWTIESQLLATDRYARQVPLIPTLDGFVGIVDNSF